MNEYTKSFEQKMKNAVRSLNELKDVFMKLGNDDYKIFNENYTLNQDFIHVIDKFSLLEKNILKANEERDVIASMKVEIGEHSTTIKMGNKEYVLPMSCTHEHSFYIFPNKNEPTFVMSVNREEGTIVVGTKDENVFEFFESLNSKLTVQNNGKSVTITSKYSDKKLHDILMENLVKAMDMVAVK
jgi:hypothetical protein